MARFVFPVPVPFRLDAVVRTHGWIHLAPWTWADGTLARRERIGRATGRLAIRQPAPGRIAVTWEGAGRAASPSRAALGAVVARALSWDWDHRPFVAIAERVAPDMAALVESGAGRFIRGTSFYEDFVKTVCTINTTWASSVHMADRLVGVVGRGLFPTPVQMLAAGEAVLKAECRVGFRARTLLRSTERMLADGAIDARGHGDAAALGYDYLLGLPGIGPYAAAHCRILLHDFSRLAVDSVLLAHCRDELGLDDAAIEAHFERWGDYRFLGYRLPRIATRQW